VHPTVAYDLARIRIADFHAAADADRLAIAARPDGGPRLHASRPSFIAAARWGNGADPTGLVRRLVGRLRPAAVAP
jgi:hypothetical protein